MPYTVSMKFDPNQENVVDSDTATEADSVDVALAPKATKPKTAKPKPAPKPYTARVRIKTKDGQVYMPGDPVPVEVVDASPWLADQKCVERKGSK